MLTTTQRIFRHIHKNQNNKGRKINNFIIILKINKKKTKQKTNLFNSIRNKLKASSSSSLMAVVRSILYLISANLFGFFVYIYIIMSLISCFRFYYCFKLHYRDIVYYNLACLIKNRILHAKRGNKNKKEK